MLEKYIAFKYYTEVIGLVAGIVCLLVYLIILWLDRK